MSVVQGSRLRERRKLLGITQEALAKAVGTNQAQISKFESGESVPSSDILAALAENLDVSADWLLGLSNNMAGCINETDLAPKEQEAVNAWRRGERLEAIKTIVLDDDVDKEQSAKDNAA